MSDETIIELSKLTIEELAELKANIDSNIESG
jgi:hypothetical protein